MTALQSVVERIIRSGGPVCTTASMPPGSFPSSHGGSGAAAAAAAASVFEKLADSRSFTGVQRERFQDAARTRAME